MFRRATIDDLRGIHHADVALAPVTVITGPPGCGKTTVLEALRIVSGGANTAAAFCGGALSRNATNGKWLPEPAWNTLFHQSDGERAERATVHAHEKDLELTSSLTLHPPTTDNEVSGVHRKTHRQWRLDVYHARVAHGERGETKTSRSSLCYYKGRYMSNEVGEAVSRRSVVVTTQRDDKLDVDRYARVAREGKHQELIERIRRVRPDVETIEALPVGHRRMALHARCGDGSLPLQNLGAAAEHAVRLLLAVTAAGPALVLADDVDAYADTAAMAGIGAGLAETAGRTQIVAAARDAANAERLAKTAGGASVTLARLS